MRDRPAILSWRHPWPVAGLLAVVALVVYGNGLLGELVFDDDYAITNNPSIRQFSSVLQPPGNLTVGGRPFLNLTFAANYAISGTSPWSYHVVNLLIHWAAALVLFGIVRRTLLRPTWGHRFDADAFALAAATALLWMIHPLQTESVTYISQRAESLMGLFYLLTLYALIRIGESPVERVRWSACGIAACYLGMATKEAMVTAPVLMLLYDRTFLAGTFREALRQRTVFYLGLASSWLLLVWLLADVGARSVGLGLGVSPWHYALTQCAALGDYLWLTVWPHPLIIDYGTQLVDRPSEVWPQALLILILLAATVVLLIRRSASGFAGVWFFLVLAPTSSFIPLVLDPITEHRMYLPLAALILALVLALYSLLGRNTAWILLPLVLLWSALTIARNEDYRTALSLWAQTAEARPTNSRAQNNYGDLLLRNGRPVEAMHQFEAALRLNPDYVEAETNWGNALAQTGQLDKAIRHYQNAIRINPKEAPPHNNWGNVLRQQEKLPEAMEHYRAAIALDPKYLEAHYNYANALILSGQSAQALVQFQECARLAPENAEVHASWGRLLAELGRMPEAIAQFTETVRLDPNNPEAHNNLGVVLARQGLQAEAAQEFQEALRLSPTYSPARVNLDHLGNP